MNEELTVHGSDRRIDMAVKDAFSMNLEEWKASLAQMGEKPFRAGQIFSWLHKNHAASYEEMTNLSKGLREKLEEIPLHPIQVSLVQRSAKDETRKYLMGMWDGEQIETVLMKYHYGYSLCISSQVGCRMGCRFCASTLSGKKRDLTAGEMLQQVYEVEREAGVVISHVVVMGCGEPFDNYEELIRFLSLINDPAGKNLSMRNITVSTCGLVDRMRDFANLKLGVTLAVSLHAPNDELRRSIMPIANSVSMDQLMAACRDYVERTHRRITFEYAMIQNVNDGPEHARELASHIGKMLSHVNLIPVNPVKERDFKSSQKERVEQFSSILEDYGIEVTVRREMGRDIDAACGQLRRSHEKDQVEKR